MGSINEFLIQVYFGQLYSGLGKKMYSKSLSLALSLAEVNDETRHLNRLKFIYANTTEKIRIPLPILESIIDKQYMFKKQLPKMQKQRINNQLIPNHKIIKALADAYVEITTIVTKIAKGLNVDIPFDMNRYPVDRE